LHSAIRNLKIRNLRAQLELCRIAFVSLERELDKADLSNEERLNTLIRWGDLRIEVDAVRGALEILEREEKEGHGDPDVLTPES
jgi:hypothetical protein